MNPLWLEASILRAFGWRVGMRTRPWSREDRDLIRVIQVTEDEPGYTVGRDVPDLDDVQTRAIVLQCIASVRLEPPDHG